MVDLVGSESWYHCDHPSRVCTYCSLRAATAAAISVNMHTLVEPAELAVVGAADTVGAKAVTVPRVKVVPCDVLAAATAVVKADMSLASVVAAVLAAADLAAGTWEVKVTVTARRAATPDTEAPVSYTQAFEAMVRVIPIAHSMVALVAATLNWVTDMSEKVIFCTIWIGALPVTTKGVVPPEV